MSRIFFSVDVHGGTGVWKKWLKAPEIYQADTLMFCGDLTGKVLVPLIKQKDGSYLMNYGEPRTLTTRAEIEEAKTTLQMGGMYPYECTQEEVDEFRVSKRKVEEVMKGLMIQRLREWIEMLLKSIEPKKLKAVIMPGNDDAFEVDNVIREYEDRGVIWPLDNVIEVGGFETISLSEVNPTPWNSPREVEEKDLAKKIETLASKLTDPHKAFFNFHAPPYMTAIDTAPKLSKGLTPVMGPGGVEMIHVGSKAVKDAIKQYQPLLGLHGHIHEAGGMDKVGKTPVLNPGSEYGENILRAFMIVTDEKGVKGYWRVEG
jgi:Icc-related predicted phosphoesterase